MNSSLLRYLIIGGLVVGLLSGCASDESRTVSPERHPNLAAAQTFVERAIEKISDAQRKHDFDLNGHAARAKELLDEAYTEIKLAAEAANR